jgi:hypothetical protein
VGPPAAGIFGPAVRLRLDEGNPVSWLKNSGFALMLWLLVAPARAGGESPAPDAERLYHRFGAWVELTAEGTVTAAALPDDTRLPAALRDPLVQHIRAMRFEPAQVDGVAKPSRSWLDGGVRLVPQADGNHTLKVEPRDLGPRPLKPLFPFIDRAPAKPQRYLLRFEVTPEGRTRDIEITAFDGRSSHSRSLRLALQDLRFEPEQVDGQPVATVLRWPFQTRDGKGEEKPFDLPALPRDPSRPGVPGQDAYAVATIFTAIRWVERKP